MEADQEFLLFAAAAKEYRVLIFDDDVPLGEMLREFLVSACECNVTYVNDEEEFWSLVKHQPFDILFLDYKLRTTDGLDILARMNAGGFGIPTIMLTGEGNETIAARAIQAGAMDYLVKGEYSFTALPGLIQKAAQVRKLQTAMQQSLERVQFHAMLLNNIRDAVVVWGMNGKIAHWNYAAEELYERKAAEMADKLVRQAYFSIFSPPIELPTLPSKEKYRSERRYIKKSGQTTWISSQISILFDHANMPVGFMDVTRDITESKRSQEELVKSQRLIQRILDTSPNIIYILDLAKQQITYVNSELEVLLGWTVEELMKTKFEALHQCVHPDDISNLSNHYGNIRKLSDNKVLEIEFRFKHKDQHWRWLKNRETVFSRGAHGEAIEIIGVSEEITPHRLAQERLAESEARYRAIVEEHQTEMICRFLPDATLTFVNEAFIHYYHRKREELTGTSFLGPIHPEDVDATWAEITALTPSKPVCTVAYRLAKADKKPRWQEWVIRAIFGEQNTFVEYQGVGRDITERKEMEEKIQAAQNRLAQTSRLASLGQLAAGVAHQISNPLTTVIADAQLLLNVLERDHPGYESADAIATAGWRAQQVIAELMKFSQPPEDEQELVDLNETIRRALMLVETYIQVAQTNLSVSLPNQPQYLIGNSRQLTDVWVNLLLLARPTFSEHEPQNITVSVQPQGETEILVKICDDGQPIPPDQLETIFEPQLIPTGEAGRGTGIELSLCREIVRQHRGTISLTSKDHLTEFIIVFPRG